MIILGIDPSIKNTGYAIISGQNNNIEVMDAGSIPFKLSQGKRKQAEELAMLSLIYEYISKLASRFPIDAFSIELPPPVCRKGAQRLQQVVGAIKAAIGANNIVEGSEYYPATVKLTVGGHGNAEKSNVFDGVARLLTERWEFRNYDESDAAAVAITHWLKKTEEAKQEHHRKHHRKHLRKQTPTNNESNA